MYSRLNAFQPPKRRLVSCRLSNQTEGSCWSVRLPDFLLAHAPAAKRAVVVTASPSGLLCFAVVACLLARSSLQPALGSPTYLPTYPPTHLSTHPPTYLPTHPPSSRPACLSSTPSPTCAHESRSVPGPVLLQTLCSSFCMRAPIHGLIYCYCCLHLCLCLGLYLCHHLHLCLSPCNTALCPCLARRPP